MKKILVLSLIFVVLASMLFAGSYNINLQSYNSPTKILRNNSYEMEARFSFGSVNAFDVSTKKGVFSEITIPGTYPDGNLGEPKLPTVKKLIEVPFGADVNVQVLDYDVNEYKLSDFGITHPIIPNQPSLPKNIDPSTVDFIYNQSVYKTDSFTKKGEFASIKVLGTLRAARIARLVIRPVEYNPVKGVIRVYNNIKVKVTFNHPDIAKTQYIKNATYSPYFESVYKRLFNYRDRDHDYPDHPDLTKYPIKYLIISDRMFEDQLQPFIQWKTEKGFNVIVAYTDEIGNSVNQIQTYIQSVYNAGTPEDPAPTFCLLVGDTPQIPASATGSATQKKTDLYYFSIDGDYFPEIYYGRFSATNTSELQPQIDKTLYYEKYEFADPTYLDNATLIAGEDGTWNPRVGQPTVEYGTENYFNAEHGFSNVNAYLNSYTGCYDTINSGLGFILYTAHGSQTSWAGPQFNVSDVYSLTNENKYPLAIGNCCLSGDFGYDECYGEAWLRAQNKGSIGYIGSSPSSYWFEDFYWAVGAFPIQGNNDGYVPSYDETSWGALDAPFVTDYNANDALVFIGNLAVTEVDIQGYPQQASPLYYWQAYNLLGDPSVVTYLTQGSVNNVSHMDILPIGVSQYEVSAEPGSYVAISFNGELKGVALVGDSGTVQVPLIPITNAGTAKIVVTKPQFQPVIEEVVVAPLDGPYVTVNNYTVSTTNGDDVVEYGESANISVDFKNVGTETATNVVATISTNDTYVTITDNTEDLGSLTADQIISVADAFAFTVANDVPDNHQIDFTVTITGAGDLVWESSLSITAYAPVLSIDHVTVIDGENGRLDPGETADIKVTLHNSGGAVLNNIAAVLASNDAFITINNANANLATIAANGDGEVTFNVTTSPETEVGHSVEFSVAVSGDNDYTFNDNFSLSVGLVLEDFETGDFSAYPWEFNGLVDWQITGDAYEGNYAAVSGDIDDSQESSMEVTLNVVATGELSFYYKVSSESGYDFLKFYLDGEEVSAWSGEVDWTEFSTEIPAGIHTFKWSYEKDGSVSNGSDCGWIDYIIFPAIGELIPPDFVITPDTIEVSLAQNGSAQRTITLANNGGGVVNYALSIFSADRSIDGSTLTCDLSSYTPGNSYTLTFTVTNGSSDAEWLTDISIAFPAGVIVNGSTDFEGGSAPLVTNNETGDGVTVTWVDGNGGYGNIHGNESATATVDITVSSAFGGDMTLNWHLVGDQWGSDPHELDGQIVLTQEGEAITWISLSETNGSVGPQESNDVTVYFNSNDLEWGNIYTCEIHVTDDLGRNVTVIPVTLNYNGDDFNNNNIIPLKNELAANYPNPFNPTTTIKYGLKSDSNVNLAIYNLKGQLVKTLVNKHQKAGYHKIVWNGKDNSGKTASSGVYFFRIKAGKFTSTKKMIMLK